MDGDLANRHFTVDESSVTQLDTLYEASRELKSSKSVLETNKNSEAIETINTSYTSLKTDISLTTSDSLGNNSIISILSELRGWSDAGQNRYQKTCSPASRDVWVEKTGNCPAGFTQGSAIGSQSCLLITDFTQSSASSRYSGQTGCTITGSTDFTSVSDAVGSYVGNLNVYINDNTNLLDNLITRNNEINQKFVAIATRIIDFLQRMEGVIDPLLEVFENLVGSNGLFSIVNCGFMKDSMNNIFLELQNELSPNSFSMGGIIIAVSFLQYLSVILLFILINKFRDNGEKNENEEYVKVHHKA